MWIIIYVVKIARNEPQSRTSNYEQHDKIRAGAKHF